jgi:hypothetical protein
LRDLSTSSIRNSSFTPIPRETISLAREIDKPIPNLEGLNKIGLTKPLVESLRELQKLAVLRKPPNYITRVLPTFGGDPTNQVLNLVEPSNQALFTDVVANAARKKGMTKWAYESYGAIPRDIKHSINADVTSSLKEKGLKGVLYPTSRYGEHEFRMLYPEDVKLLDRRLTSDPAFNEIQKWYSDSMATPGTTLNEWKSLSESGPGPLREILGEHDFKSKLLSNDEANRGALDIVDQINSLLSGNRDQTRYYKPQIDALINGISQFINFLPTHDVSNRQVDTLLEELSDRIKLGADLRPSRTP